MAIVIIGMNFKEVPGVFLLIFRSAFHLEPAFAGVFGMAIAWGINRGIYSNEAGQGTAPHAAAAAEVTHPVKQGLVQAFPIYVDTLLVCSATAFMILFSGKYNVVNPNGGFLVEYLPGVPFGSAFTQEAIGKYFPSLGHGFVAIALFLFAFTTIMAYYYMAETNISYLFPKGNKTMIWALRLLICLSTFYGTIKTAESAWVLGDMRVRTMAWLNMVAIFLLQKHAMLAFKDYQQQKKAGVDPVFHPEALGIKGTSEWEG